jgi:Domain of unknown function (DUF4304)
MVKNDLINIINEILVPIGFKRKGNYWVFNGKQIAKIVNLQRSNFGDLFYVNYGFTLKSIPSDGGSMHIYNRLTSPDADERNKINLLLGGDDNIPYQERRTDLSQILHNNLLSKIQSVNSEQDILEELSCRPHLNDIPVVVKRHFNLQ